MDLARFQARIGERTFAITTDLAEAHRQIPIEVGGDVYNNNKVGTFGVTLRFILLVSRGHNHRQTCTVHSCKKRYGMAPSRRR